MRHVLDRFLTKLVSRKLMVWMTACGLLMYSGLSSSDWVAISLAYIGSQGMIDIAKAWRHGE